MNFNQTEQQPKQMSLMKAITNDNKTLNSLDRNVLIELASPFKIQDGKIFDPSEILMRLKVKIAQICYSEKEQCMNYLMLAKFKALSSKTYGLLSQIINQVWSSYIAQLKDFQALEKVSKLVCKSDTLQQKQNFHLRNYYLFKNALSLQPPPDIASYHSYHHHGFQNMIPNMLHQNSFQPMNIGFQSNFQIGPTIQGYLSNSNIVPKIQESQPNRSHQRGEDSAKKQQKIEEDSPFIVYSNVRKSKEYTLSPSQKPFHYCSCRGKISTEENSFSCELCQKKFHLNCLFVDNPDLTEQMKKITCPFCFMKDSSIFYDVVGDPLDFFWSTDKDANLRKITIKNKKCRELLEKKLMVQIKFATIVGCQLFQSKKNLDSSNKISDITIGEQILSKHNGEDIKISIEALKQSACEGDDKSQFLTIVYPIKQLNEEQTLKKVTEYTDEEYLQQYMPAGENQLKIQILNHEGSLIKIPGRGVDCNHPDVFDISEYIGYSIQNYMENICFICQKPCMKVKIDRCIQRQIQKIRQVSMTSIPHVIYLQKNGVFRWGPIEKYQNVKKFIKAPMQQQQIDYEDSFSSSSDDSEMIDM